MLYKGEKLTPYVAELYLPRNKGAICIRAAAVLSYDEFHKIVPSPKPPEKIIKGGARVPDFESRFYKGELNDYGRHKQNWMFLKSLAASTEITWETIDWTDPTTWGNYEKELEEAGFSEFERQMIFALVMEANGLDQRKLEEARESFLTALANPQPNGSTSPKVEPNSTPNGEQPSGSASVQS